MSLVNQILMINFTIPKTEAKLTILFVFNQCRNSEFSLHFTYCVHLCKTLTSNQSFYPDFTGVKLVACQQCIRPSTAVTLRVEYGIWAPYTYPRGDEAEKKANLSTIHTAVAESESYYFLFINTVNGLEVYTALLAWFPCLHPSSMNNHLSWRTNI